MAEKYGARYVVLKRLGDRLAGVDVPADGLAPAGDGRGAGRIVETNHYEYLAVSPNDRVTFEVWSPSDRTATLVLRAKRRDRAQATLGTLSVNGTPTTIADSELPRDTWADVRRDVSLKAGRNEVRLESAAQLEVIRVAAYSLTLADLPADLAGRARGRLVRGAGHARRPRPPHAETASPRARTGSR